MLRVKSERFIGDVLVHPLALLSLVVLIINDHILKTTYANDATGKLSDFAGLVFFPLLVVVLIESTCSIFGISKVYLSPSSIARVIVFVAIGYVSVKSLQPIANLYSAILGFSEWAAALFPRLARGVPIGNITPRRIIADPSDLLALPMLLIAWLIAWRFRSAQ